jgi:acyl-homoserine lactone acylase PvdQ
MTPRSLSHLILLTAASLSLCFALRTDSRTNEIARSVTIYRDTYGVPHVYGPTTQVWYSVSCMNKLKIISRRSRKTTFVL